MAKAPLGLAEAIGALRAELAAAMAEGVGKEFQFTLDPIELTIQTVITKDVNGKVGWQVLEAGGSYESAATHSLTLRLTSWWRDEDGRLVRDFAIADASLSAGERYHAGPTPAASPAAGQ